MKVALIYDFDKTLSTTDMQNYDFIQNLGIEVSKFWEETGKLTKDNEADKILCYMYEMIKMCKEKNISLTREYLQSCGKNIIFHNGVLDWFSRINRYAMTLGVELKHYIISSGITEIIEGTEIYKYFEKVYGCSFIYENGVAVWPKMSVNYTQKTQFLFRIAKGALDLTDDEMINKKAKKLDIEYRNMIYLGDGLTDIPCMKLIKERGGSSIALYHLGKEDKILDILNDDRVNIAVPADFSEGSKLDEAVKLMIGHMALLSNLKNKEKDEISAILGGKKIEN